MALERRTSREGCVQYFKVFEVGGEPTHMASLIKGEGGWKVTFTRFGDGDNAPFTPDELHQLGADLFKLQN